ncbi:hypothetical protein NUU61_000170 [Penicillium alfredii]|uniref:Uncharacterized protein n=1 Tax=Penicillium alfredii TaxID=1506179 RepID=A0A9W9G9A4_9EURO|nr:uncharacterized protein NUU61_000170 [Penicillium alfredii]KAJ5114411.1 hypothetical protein NUU61_000170 [Penicillium alfredii]
MRFFSYLGSFIATGAALSSAASPSCSPSSGDTQVLQFAWAISEFVGQFYASIPINQTFAGGLQNSTSAKVALANLKGIEKKSNLTIQAIKQVSWKAPNFKKPSCKYTIPKANSVLSFARYAYQFETTLSGAYIGLAGYTQSPEVSFLLARLAAEHSAHATWIGNRVNSTLFPTNSSSLFPAYLPTQVLKSKNETGSLGRYLHGCVTAPSSPCGSLKIGPLDANTTTSSASASSSTAKASRRRLY